jgi:hypothetical protein
LYFHDSQPALVERTPSVLGSLAPLLWLAQSQRLRVIDPAKAVQCSLAQGALDNGTCFAL